MLTIQRNLATTWACTRSGLFHITMTSYKEINWGFSKLGIPSCGVGHGKDYRILGSIFGYSYFGKLPCGRYSSLIYHHKAPPDEHASIEGLGLRV